MYVLDTNGHYQEVARSRWLAPLTPEAATEFVRARARLTRQSAWVAMIGKWYSDAVR